MQAIKKFCMSINAVKITVEEIDSVTLEVDLSSLKFMIFKDFQILAYMMLHVTQFDLRVEFMPGG